MEQRFTNRTAIITGAASGMGLETSKQLSLEGAIVYMDDINEERLNAAANEIKNAVPCVCDLRDFDQIAAVTARVMHEQGHIDILVSFAGGFPPRMCGTAG